MAPLENKTLALLIQLPPSIQILKGLERLRDYAGFGPGTANVFRNMLGLAEAKWEDKDEEDQQMQYQAHNSEQRTLIDFLI